MKLSVKSDYAARAVLGLAQHYPERAALRMEDVADEQGVPPKYLPQILIELKARGIVRSVRGKEGGHLHDEIGSCRGSKRSLFQDCLDGYP